MEIYDPTCGSGGLLIKCELAMEAKMKAAKKTKDAPLPLKLFGQEYVPETWAMANMNMIIHDMEGQIEIGDTFKNPKFRAEKSGQLRTFDRVVANPMWNQDSYTEADYDNDELDRFASRGRFPRKIFRRLGLDPAHARQPQCRPAAPPSSSIPVPSPEARAMPAPTRRKPSANGSLTQDLIESVLYLPENLFYNTTAPGIVLFLNKAKPKARQSKIFLVNASRSLREG